MYIVFNGGVNMAEKNVVKLVCEDCGGTMNIDADKQIMMCPFCGSKKIILEGDDVKIAKIQADAEVEKQRINKDLEMAKIDETKRKAKEENIYVICYFVFIIIILIILWFI